MTAAEAFEQQVGWARLALVSGKLREAAVHLENAATGLRALEHLQMEGALNGDD